tara:strand:+ start:9916 stop:10293 length:378 start_codon:yes stop_codon:yes gene_type:complete
MLYKKIKDTSRTSPSNNSRACLCADGNTYSKNCCNGKMINEGIGNITGHSTIGDENYYRVLKCDSGIQKDIHVHNSSLTISSAYYLEFENPDYNGCYEVIGDPAYSGVHVENFTLYSNCANCLAV